MPKSSKKKKAKAADFSKAKLKLGKGKHLPNNATDTSFKARSIALPHQSLGLEKDASKPTTRRNLTIDDLLVHLKHYNANTRKDAICGLRELLQGHPQLTESSLAPIIQSCARIVGDEDAEVRRALLEFFTWFIRLTPFDQFRPHVPLLILFINSAQSHIFPAIRIDAVRFLDLLLEFIPEAVTYGWDEPESIGSRTLEGYLGLLDAGSGFWASHKDNHIPSTSSVNLSPTSKLIVLSSLATFLHTAMSSSVSQQIHTIPTWYMASSFSAHAEFVSFCSLVQLGATGTSEIKQVEWCNNAQGYEDFVGNFTSEYNIPIDHGYSLNELGEVAQAVETFPSDLAGASYSDSRSLRVARLARTIHPVLISTWLDVGHTAFGLGASGTGIETQLVASVGQIAGCLYGAIFRDLNLPKDAQTAALDDLTILLGYMSTYLPCNLHLEDAQLEWRLHKLNFAYCELTSLAVIESQHKDVVTPANRHTSLKSKQRKSLSTQVERVGDYVVKALDGELKSPSHPLGYSLTASLYTSLLPTLWSLLKYKGTSENDAMASRICTSIVNHAIRTSARSAAKGTATQFVGILVLLSTHPRTSLDFFPAIILNKCELFKEWYLQLPKVLWEIGSGDHKLTETILRLILRICQRRSPLFDTTTLASVRSRLIPYFATVHPHKGEILGPFVKLKQNAALRRLALDVTLALLQDASSVEDDELKMAVDKAVDGTVDAIYWRSILHSSFR